MTTAAEKGITQLTAAHSVDDVLQRLLSLLETKGVKVFAVVDHSGEARKVGLEMHNTKLVLFGNPKAGTPVMLAAPDSALDLPLKILIAERPDGTTRISFNSTDYLQARYGLSSELARNLAVIGQLAATVAGT